MAEKSGDKVRRGFFSYFFLFMVFLLAAFGICIAIMIFNPGKEVLGLKYFSGNSSKVFVETTDESKEELNIGTRNYDEIIVNMDYGKAIIQRSTSYNKNGIVIINRAKGFSTANSNTDFKSSITIADNVLSINIESQPEGFLFFSKDVEVIIHLSDVVDNTSNPSDNNYAEAFKNTKFTINTKSADVQIGSGLKSGYTRNVYVDSLDVSTVSGNIEFKDHAPQNYDSLSLKTKSGKVSFAKDSIKVSSDINWSIGNGVLRMKELYLESDSAPVTKYNANISIDGGTLGINKLSCNTANYEFSTGRIEISTLVGDVNFINSSEIISKGNIYFKEIIGDFSMPVGNDVDIDIGTVRNIYCATTGGSISANSTSTMNLSTVSGTITAKIGSSIFSRTISSETGTINLSFADGITGDKNTVLNNTGNITISFVNTTKAKFNFDYLDNIEQKQFDLSKVTLDVLTTEPISTNPYYYNSTESDVAGIMNIKTNGLVQLQLI